VFTHWPYLIILAVIALIIFGPKRLPELGEGLGKAIREFRKATSEMGDSLKSEVHQPDTATGTTYTAPVEPVAPVAPAVVPPTTAATPAPASAPPPEAPRS
jgi:TatA/E family protein of Tat protein translocase